ncbi:hypothetical protein, partial [Psychrobacter sp.]|uniref:hypothetical protein n=1 Tax=Psychrobacter sp. TaxID=56811 RepID=UPI0025F03BA0
MIWLTGIVAIALMLAILELDPNQLYMLSHSVYQVNSERWQDVSYYLLGAIVLFRLGSYLSSFLVSFLVSFLN